MQHVSGDESRTLRLSHNNAVMSLTHSRVRKEAHLLVVHYLAITNTRFFLVIFHLADISLVVD